MLKALFYRWCHLGGAISIGPLSIALGLDGSLVLSAPVAEFSVNKTTAAARIGIIGVYAECVYDRGYDFELLK